MWTRPARPCLQTTRRRGPDLQERAPRNCLSLDKLYLYFMRDETFADGLT
jgi:hypothetical protein